MKLKDARGHYYEFSGKLSDVNRSLCFAGIAVIWIFVQKENSDIYAVPRGLLIPLLLFVLGLASDLFQYLVSATSWGFFHRIKEKSGIDEDEDFKAPKWINWPPLVCFYSKAVLNICGYVALTLFLWDAVSSTKPLS